YSTITNHTTQLTIIKHITKQKSHNSSFTNPQQITTKQKPQKTILKKLNKHKPHNQQTINIKLNNNKSYYSTNNNQTHNQTKITQLN
ncbi:hypothetical protein, partial [Klebsiella pneumoniae]|uniref:hypothetical protein n=1 Tax=Klebsiella pneumoniae TaxID=573 RepID=UPI003EB828AE